MQNKVIGQYQKEGNSSETFKTEDITSQGKQKDDSSNNFVSPGTNKKMKFIRMSSKNLYKIYND